LNSKQLHIDKIEIDKLFETSENVSKPSLKTNVLQTNDLFSPNFNIESLSKVDEPLNSTKKKEDINELLFKSFEEWNSSIHPRKWVIAVSDNFHYGPYNSEEIYAFLFNLFDKSPEAKEVHSFMVVNSESDIYYQPDAVLEMLEKEVKDKILPIDPKEELERLVIQIQPEEDFSRERKFSDNPNLITKFDSGRRRSKFKNTEYLPLKELHQQFRNPGDYGKQNYNQNQYNSYHKTRSFGGNNRDFYTPHNKYNQSQGGQRYHHTQNYFKPENSQFNEQEKTEPQPLQEKKQSKVTLVSIKDTLFD
jgi:hypothetical protein